MCTYKSIAVSRKLESYKKSIKNVSLKRKVSSFRNVVSPNCITCMS